MNILDESKEVDKYPHRRLNPLTGEWVLVSPNRSQRPWQGRLEKPSMTAALAYDPKCYLCPGNARAGGVRNPQYTSTFVFTNDFPALQLDAPTLRSNQDGRGLLVSESQSGTCKVVCFSPRHNLTLAKMNRQELRKVIDTWIGEYSGLAALSNVRYVQIFENRGEIMGCSNPHPHCQIWATQNIPNEPVKEQRSQFEYFQQRGSCLLCDYLKLEGQFQTRLVCANASFVAIVPFWAIWPFEILVIANAHLPDLQAVNERQRSDLADILQRITANYDALFGVQFPYSMGFHQAPTDHEPHPEWHFHAHFYPPLLRSATVRKFMVGYEMLAEPQRDLAPEAAAERLREIDKTKNRRCQ